MFPIAPRSGHSTKAVAVAIVLALSALAAAPAVGATDAPSGAWATIARFMGEHDLSWSDIPALVEVRSVDIATGESSIAEMPLADALALAPADGPGTPQPMSGHAHFVTGYVTHRCDDPFRWCYSLDRHLESTGGTLSAEHDAANEGYEGVTGHGLPVAGSEIIRVKGQYPYGSHSVGASSPVGGPGFEGGLPGAGPTSPHADRSMAGYGVGSITLVAFPWGPTFLFSYGWMTAFGQFVFCDAEATAECAEFGEVYDEVTATKAIAGL